MLLFLLVFSFVGGVLLFLAVSVIHEKSSRWVTTKLNETAEKIQLGRHLWATRGMPAWRLFTNSAGVYGLMSEADYQAQVKDLSCWKVPFGCDEDFFVPRRGVYFFSAKKDKYNRTVGTYEEMLKFLGDDRVLRTEKKVLFVPHLGYGNDVAIAWSMYPNPQPTFAEFCSRQSRPHLVNA